jgi:hypothetical protein
MHILYVLYFMHDFSEKGVRLAQKTLVGPCIPVGTQL